METATAAKICVKCRKDVTNGKRMKDAQGAYWCVDCGSEDSRAKHTKLQCADCRAKRPSDKMKLVDGENVCEECAATRAVRGATAAKDGAALEGSGEDSARMLKLGAGIGTIGIGVSLIALYLLGYIG